MQYGKHYILECTVSDNTLLTNPEGIQNFFARIVSTLHMTPVSECTYHIFPGSGGITAFQIIAESHISIHTWPEYHYFSFDVFSCKGFDDAALDVLVHATFPIAKKVSQVVHRGTLMLDAPNLTEAPTKSPSASPASFPASLS
ncbi:MAG: adenosylmethionine decarboxylase [Patescibacteria group bacterium]|nr:adenosylmethionine decarboxylase [Patescibacteria group bacterium]MDE2437782.1 adenosylmethionine decarboxylase [Patescibacteria group bacterium]